MSDSFGNSLTFFVNGKKYSLSETKIDPKWTLLQFLRKSGLTGTKLGCGEGGCGACTVMLSVFDPESERPNHFSANACLTPLCALDGVAVTTVEGIGGMKQGLHPVQRRIAAMHGSQCGFCTPGIVMAIYAFLRANPNASPHEIEESLDGNLCRCTGYRPIIDAARSLSNNKGENSTCCGGKQQQQSGGCCGGNGDGFGKKQGCPCADSASAILGGSSQEFKCSSSEGVLAELPSLNEEMTARGLSEPIFPPSLTHYRPQSLRISNDGVTWFQPVSLQQLLKMKAEHPAARLVVGNTEVGIEVKFKAMEYPTLLNPSHVPELQVLEESTAEDGTEGIKVGAAVNINRLRNFIKQLEADNSANEGKRTGLYKLRGLVAIHGMLSWFASNHIRNMACVGGNIVTASPISDLNPMLMACGAVLTMNSKAGGERRVPIDQFFLSYRKVDLHPDEVLQHVFVPFTQQCEFVLPFKQARRREDDISIVTAGIRIKLEPVPGNGDGGATSAGWAVVDCSLAYGGMAPTTILAAKTATAMKGQAWSLDAVQALFPCLREEMALPASVPGGQPEFRTTLAVSFLLKAYLTITTALQEVQSTLPFAALVEQIDAADASATTNFLTASKAYTRGEQGYMCRSDMPPTEYPPAVAAVATPPAPQAAGGGGGAKPVAQPFESEVATATRGAVGQPLMHKNAAAQVSGETKYTDDLPKPVGTLHACLVLSTKPHARLLSVDIAAAEACPGFVAYFSAKDVTGSNKIGAVIKDEEVFATDVVKNCGAVIGVVIAESHEEAVYAVRKVVVEYEDLPAVISIQDAIAAKSFYPSVHELSNGDMAAQKSKADVHVQGRCRMGSQEHFYLETNATLVIPQEGGQLEVFSSTQACTKTQNMCASVCGLPASKVVAKCKRLGGGFGGKETRSVFIACAAALAAQLLERPVSILIERDVDMSITGQRHAFEVEYSAGCSKDGQLCYLDVNLYNNAGFSLDLSQPVVDRALFHIDNCYNWPALHARGYVCLTNQPSHTAFRGFGGPQGLAACEMILQHLANASRVPIETIRDKNMYRTGQRTHFGQTLVDFYVPDLWQKMHQLADVASRQEQVAEFNRKNRWRKRGLCVVPTKFGINFTAKFMNQGGALVHVYVDGSVLVAHGGTEMGQGLNTKVIQIAAQCLGISDELVIITETSTSTVANTSPTAASASTDLYGMAVLRACQEIKQRLMPLKERLPKDTDWKSLVTAAFFERIDLSAHGYYAIDSERCGFDWDMECTDNAQRGLPFNYFTQGVACSEVEIDCLTGDAQVVRADVLMDVGKSINPGIDIGQIEGSYVQGFGWSTMEEMTWGDADHQWVRPGQLFTRGPGTYKIPAFNDVPVDFRVHLSDTHNRDFAVHSAKAVGEPPFFLGASAFFAIKSAIDAAREQNGCGGAAAGVGASASVSAAHQQQYYQLDMPATSERIRMACCDSISRMCIQQQPVANPNPNAHANASAINGGSGKGNGSAVADLEQFHPKGSW